MNIMNRIIENKLVVINGEKVGKRDNIGVGIKRNKLLCTKQWIKVHNDTKYNYPLRELKMNLAEKTQCLVSIKDNC